MELSTLVSLLYAQVNVQCKHDPPNRQNSPFSATRTTIHSFSGKNTFILIWYKNINRSTLRLSGLYVRFLWEFKVCVCALWRNCWPWNLPWIERAGIKSENIHNVNGKLSIIWKLIPAYFLHLRFFSLWRTFESPARQQEFKVWIRSPLYAHVCH